MAGDKNQPTQRTPEGAEIPVPKRNDFMRNMDKVAPPVRPADEREPESPADDSPEQ
jgi:hypothetical protein